jgi:hypothetical protein
VDLGKCGYKTKKEVENPGIQLHVDQSWVTKYGNFKKGKLEICPNPPKKILVIS